MLSVKRSLSVPSEFESPAKVSKKVNVSFLKYAYETNKDFDVDVSNQNGDWKVNVTSVGTTYGYRLMSPPCMVKWNDLKPGGNVGKFDPPILPTAAKLTVTLNMSHEDKWSTQRNGFMGHLKKMNETILSNVFDKHTDLKKIFMDRAKTFCKGKKKADIPKIAKNLFLKAAKTPLKETKDNEVFLSTNCRAYRKENDELVERDVTFYKYKKKQYHNVEEPMTVASGDLIGVVFQPMFYALPGYSTFGISYRLDNRSVIMYKRSMSSQGCSNAVLNDNQRAYAFKYVKGNVYINDTKGRRYELRTPPIKIKYCDLIDGTLGKFPGVTEATASLTASLEPIAESDAWMKHFETLCNDCGTFLFEHPECLSKLKQDLLNTATEMAEELGQSVESTHKNMFLSSFKIPIKNNLLRVSQRMFNKMGVRNHIPLFDKDNKPLQDATVSRNAIVQVSIAPSVYILANGTCGIKCNIHTTHGINIVQQAEDDAIENKGIYDMSDSDDED